MRGLGLILFVLLCAVAGAESAPRFSRTCAVYSEPTLTSARVCQPEAGTPIRFFHELRNGFIQIETEDCAGYLPSGCFAATDGYGARRGTASYQTGRNNTFKLGLHSHVDGTLATTTNTGLSRGSGWAYGLRLVLPFAQRFFIGVTMEFQRLGLSKAFTSSGNIIEPSATTIEQTHDFLGGGLLLGWAIQRSMLFDRPTMDPEWWLEAGVQYLQPVGGRQTITGVGTFTFKGQDKPILAIFGTSLDIALSKVFSTVGYAHLYYNVKSTSNTRLFGARLGLALAAAL